MRKLLKSLSGTQKFGVLFAFVLIYPIASPCDALGALFGGDNYMPLCTPFIFTSVKGLPGGPAVVTWNPVKGATGYNILVATDYTPVLGNASVAGDQTSTSITLNDAGIGIALSHDGKFYVLGFALTGVADPPWCEAVKSLTFTVTPKNHKNEIPSHVPTPTFTPPPPPPASHNSGGSSGSGGSTPKKPTPCPKFGVPPNCYSIQ